MFDFLLRMDLLYIKFLIKESEGDENSLIDLTNGKELAKCIDDGTFVFIIFGIIFLKFII